MQWWCAAQGVPWTWEWRPYPGVWLFIAALALGYAALRRVSAPGGDLQEGPSTAPPPGPHGSPVAFGAGLLVLWIALDWPVGALGAGYLASVHMVQFLLIALLAPPLLLLGVPRSAYGALAARGGRGLRAATHPLTALAVFTGTMALTHWPPLVDVLMVDQLGSFALDTVWLGSGLLFWWPVAAPVPERPWLGQPVKMGYLIAATLLNTGVFAYLTFSGMPLYATFELAPPVSGLSTRDDQLVAGLLMKMGGAVILWTSITILFFRWVAQQERPEGPPPARSAALAVAAAMTLAVTACGGDAPESSDDAPPAAAADAPAPLPAVIAGDLEVGSVVATEPVAGGPAAIYLSVRNRGRAADALLAVEAPAAARAGLHRTSRDGGVSTMRPADSVPVPAGGEARLAPGGFHAMLEGLGAPVEAGDTVAITLRFRDAGDVEVRALVVSYADLDALHPAPGGAPEHEAHRGGGG